MRRLLSFTFALLVCVSSAVAQAQAQAPASNETEDIDDPKVSRRLGTRIRWGAPPPPAPAIGVGAATAAAAAAARRAAAPPPPVAEPPALDADAGVPTVARSAAPPPAPGTPAFTPPRLKVGFRHFNFVRIGASSSVDGTVAREPFNSVGVDIYPLTSLVRVGLTTQYGWQSGSFVSDGDYFAAQSISAGTQYLDAGRFVPFVEAFGGIGYMRRLQFDRTVPTVYWQLGVDIGTEIYFARTGYVSLAFGYLRPVNGFARVQQFDTVFVDTWSFKLGLGI
jgi:hypothetical protein